MGDIDELLIKIGELIETKNGKIVSLERENQVSYLTIPEVAAILKITLLTLSDWTKLGWLTSYKMGNRVYYKRNEVEAAISKLASNKHKKYLS